MTVLGKFFGRPAKAREPSLAAGYRVYAIGDVHGRHDLLSELLAAIERDMARRAAARQVIVFLGDLIDRGPASAEVIAMLRAYRRPGVGLVFLAGNHEEVLLRILDGEEQLVGDWLRFGGAQCIQSYGVDPARLRRMSSASAVEVIRSAIPPADQQFLRGFDDTFRAGDYLFVHAGIRPGLPMAEQSQLDLRWIREPFLKASADHGFVVVHGHTISEKVEERTNRIGLDTGAYRSGILTAMGLEGSSRWFLQTGQAPEPTAEPSRAS